MAYRKKENSILFLLEWSRKIILFREIRNNDESNLNFTKLHEILQNSAKFHEILLHFISQNFAKFREISLHFISRHCFVQYIFQIPIHFETNLIKISLSINFISFL
jgi:hypothetical protein